MEFLREFRTPDRLVTVEEIMGHDPCEDYPKKRVEELWEGKEYLLLSGILKLDISVEDRIWIITRLLPKETGYCLACDFAEHALSILDKKYPDTRPRKAIEVRRKWLKGEVDNEALEAADKFILKFRKSISNGPIYCIVDAVHDTVFTHHDSSEAAYSAATSVCDAFEDSSEEEAWQIKQVMRYLVRE